MAMAGLPLTDASKHKIVKLRNNTYALLPNDRGETAGDTHVADNLHNELLEAISGEDFLAEAQRRGFALVSNEALQAGGLIEQICAEKNIPREKWGEVAAAITRLIDNFRDGLRPQWGDEENPPELAILTAPKFLKKIWADKIVDGVVRNDDIGDKGLVEAVRQYLKGREGKPDLADAEGLTIIPSSRGRRKDNALSMT